MRMMRFPSRRGEWAALGGMLGALVVSLALLGAANAEPPVLAAPAEGDASDAADLVIAPPLDDGAMLASTAEHPMDDMVAALMPAISPTVASPTPAAPAHALHRARVIWMEVTAYCPCKICCGKGAMGLTASGKRVSYNHGRFVAADTSLLPFGTRLLIPGYSSSQPVEVIDRGGAIKGYKLDVFFDTHERAMQWGRQWIPVTVLDSSPDEANRPPASPAPLIASNATD